MQIEDIPCLRCGTCCTWYQPLITDEESERIAKYLGITVEDFWEKYADTRWPIQGKHLIKHIDDHCALMKIEGYQHLCSVHSVKPDDCRAWQESLEKKECQTGLLKVWNLKIENGEVVGTEEDLDKFIKYLAEIT
jgi:Fe-S-cluster containining protein